MDIRRKLVEPQTETRTVVDQALVTDTRRRRLKSNEVESGTAAAVDTVDVSLAHEINSEGGTERQEKIAKLKELIESGKYKPDSKAVAGALLNVINDEIWFEKMRGGAANPGGDTDEA
jgi:anti-sigma28 factor (negative regulator of flagellin synthesis)